MPFAVVETINARGCKELSVVPCNWLRTSRSGNIVLWPNAKRIADQEKLLHDENSFPKKSWLKYKCTVKRNAIMSYAAAKLMLEELSGESSSDVNQLIRRKKKQHNHDKESFQNMFVMDNTQHQNESASVDEISDSEPTVGDQFNINIGSQKSSPQVPVIVEVTENMQSEIFSQQKTPPSSSPTGIQRIEYVTYENFHEPDTLVEADNPVQECMNEIIKLRQYIEQRLDRLEKRSADICIQNEFILDALRKNSSRVTNIEEPISFCIDPIENELQLADLELKLADKDFKSKMVKWLRLHASGDCAENRMLGVLDILFSKEFQTKCTWTGASRKGPKIAIMPNRNILQLFTQVGSDEYEVVTQQKLANFFMKKLKNSLKRLLAAGMRRGTRHVRRKQRNVAEVDVVGDVLVDASSNKMNGQADKQVNSCSESESEEYAGSVVDSLDALDYAEILSNATPDFSE
ncbi:uncharacterized protein LOC128739830 [Sabethes cyaneus]|uniref:uncharacterized protein LOC128739830 n=1 Tax=Sabethes cyaneus TaxID=53552 RepID=UPI00237EC030|nr:uncharacterized protein LOC128739830 [Sabethes cyaneus]